MIEKLKKMCPNSVCCPLCSHMTFTNLITLQRRLITAANGPIICPVCKESLLGLDKFTIHLFSHTNLITDNNLLQSHQQCDNLSNLNLFDNNDNHDSSKINSNNNWSENIITNQENGLQQSQEDKHLPRDINSGSMKSDINYVSSTTHHHQQHQQNSKCTSCNIDFNSNEHSKVHNTLTELKEKLQFQCYLCSKVFKMKGSLRIHLKVAHAICINNGKMSSQARQFDKINENDRQIENPSFVQQNNSILTTSNLVESDVNKNFILKPITITFPSEGNSNEIQLINGIEAKPIISTQDLIDTQQRINNESAKVWECDVCTKSFTTKYFLKKHKRLHTGEMPYTCELCGKTFTFQQSYHKHLLYHSDDKPYSCTTCGRAFKELSTLHNHERIHSGEKPFKCEICGKCFRQRVSYLVHKRIHTGAMPYTCPICNKKFRYKVSQRTHKCNGFDQLNATLNETGSIEKSDAIQMANNVESKNVDNEKFVNNILCGTNDFGHGLDNKIDYKNASSPSQKFQNLCLSGSPESMPIISNVETISEESFKQLLFGSDEFWPT